MKKLQCEILKIDKFNAKSTAARVALHLDNVVNWLDADVERGRASLEKYAQKVIAELRIFDEKELGV